MNIWILSSGLLGIFTALVHIIAGQLDPVRPFLKSELADIPKATLLACWHMVSVTLIASATLLSFIGWKALEAHYISVVSIGTLYVLFALVFLAVGWYFFGTKALAKLPQWILLLPIGLMSIYGVL